MSRPSPEQGQQCLDGIDLVELDGLGEKMDDPITAGLIMYANQLEAMIMIYATKLGQPVTIEAIRNAGRASARKVMADG